FQNEAHAAEITEFYQSRLAQIEASVAGATRPRTLLLYYNDRDGAVAFNVPPLSWMQTQMTQMAGGEPVWADANLGGGWTQVTLEQIAAWDADQIFIIAYTRNSTEVVAELQADPNWQALRAVQFGGLHAFPGDLYSWDQPDVRWLLGLTWLAGKLHPDRFPDLDMLAEVETFYNTLYGLDAAFVEANIIPAFQGDIP
ncbi:MAG: ABC transporter substrate-binding protein, partial [Caldilinea sp.]